MPEGLGAGGAARWEVRGVAESRRWVQVRAGRRAPGAVRSPGAETPAPTSAATPGTHTPFQPGAQDNLYPILLTSRSLSGPTVLSRRGRKQKELGRFPLVTERGPDATPPPTPGHLPGTPPPDPLHPEATRRGRGSRQAGSPALSPGPAQSLSECAPRVGRFVRGPGGAGAQGPRGRGSGTAFRGPFSALGIQRNRWA